MMLSSAYCDAWQGSSLLPCTRMDDVLTRIFRHVRLWLSSLLSENLTGRSRRPPPRQRRMRGRRERRSDAVVVVPLRTSPKM